MVFLVTRISVDFHNNGLTKGQLIPSTDLNIVQETVLDIVYHLTWLETPRNTLNFFQLPSVEENNQVFHPLFVDIENDNKSTAQALGNLLEKEMPLQVPKVPDYLSLLRVNENISLEVNTWIPVFDKGNYIECKIDEYSDCNKFHQMDLTREKLNQKLNNEEGSTLYPTRLNQIRLQKFNETQSCHLELSIIQLKLLPNEEKANKEIVEKLWNELMTDEGHASVISCESKYEKPVLEFETSVDAANLPSVSWITVFWGIALIIVGFFLIFWSGYKKGKFEHELKMWKENEGGASSHKCGKKTSVNPVNEMETKENEAMELKTFSS